MGWATEASPPGMGIRETESLQRRYPGPEASPEGSSFRKKGASRSGGRCRRRDWTSPASHASSGTLPPTEVAVLFARGAAALSWEMPAAAPHS